MTTTTAPLVLRGGPLDGYEYDGEIHGSQIRMKIITGFTGAGYYSQVKCTGLDLAYGADGRWISGGEDLEVGSMTTAMREGN